MLDWPVIIVGATLFVAYANGANDNFKGVATLFGSGTTDYRKALGWATITTLAGSVTALFLAAELISVFQGKGFATGALRVGAISCSGHPGAALDSDAREQDRHADLDDPWIDRGAVRRRNSRGRFKLRVSKLFTVNFSCRYLSVPPVPWRLPDSGIHCCAASSRGQFSTRKIASVSRPATTSTVTRKVWSSSKRRPACE